MPHGGVSDYMVYYTKILHQAHQQVKSAEETDLGSSASAKTLVQRIRQSVCQVLLISPTKKQAQLYARQISYMEVISIRAISWNLSMPSEIVHISLCVRIGGWWPHGNICACILIKMVLECT